MSDIITKLLDIFEKPGLWVALRSICDNPQQELRVETPFVDVGLAQSMEPSMLGISALEPGSLAITDRMSHFVCHKQKWRFLKVYDRRIVRRELTPANQFAAYFVRQSIKLVRSVAYSIDDSDDYETYFQSLLRIVRRLNAIWDSMSSVYKFTPLDSLPLDNQLLKFEPRYHVILEAWLACESL